MNPLNIGVIVGSIRKASINAKLATALQSFAPPEYAFQRIPIHDLPLYDQDTDPLPAPVLRLRQEVLDADAILFVTPEYNRSIPSVLKNAIDHASRPHKHGVWTGKPAGVIGATPGMLGTAAAQQHLRNVLACVGMPTMAQPDAFICAGEGFFTPDGAIANPQMHAFLAEWMGCFLNWVRQHAPGN
jgi:chromate reductase, NAD(P)H dehydrogenase (quinone)